jgi:hypothetical protein
MQKSLSLFNVFIENKDLLHESTKIKDLLYEYNAYHVFKELFESDSMLETACFITSYIVFLYSNDTTWNNLDRPLSYTKSSAIENLFSLGFDKQKIDYEIESELNEHNQMFVACRSKYLVHQKDMDFTDAITLQTHIHNTQQKALDIQGSADKDFREKNVYLSTLDKHKENLKKLRQTLLKRYEPINELLEEEGLDRITKQIEVQSLEARLANKKATN